MAKEARKVSIAVGIPCSDGFVIGVDLQYSTGFVKRAGRKLFPLPRFQSPGSVYSVLIAGAGNADSTKKAVELIDLALPDSFDFPVFVECAEKSLAALFATHIDTAPREDQGDLHCNLLLGVRIGHESRLYRSNRAMLIEETGPTCIGMGLYLGNFLLDFLLRSPSMPVAVAEQVATYVIFSAKEYIESVGKGTDLHVIRNDGKHYAIYKPEREEIELCFENFFGSVRSIIKCCDTEIVSDSDVSLYVGMVEDMVNQLREAQRNRNKSRANREMLTASLARARSYRQSTTGDQSTQPPSQESPGGSGEA